MRRYKRASSATSCTSLDNGAEELFSLPAVSTDLTHVFLLGINESLLVYGKRGENPPLPRNCKREELEQDSHWVCLGRLHEFDVQNGRRVSQETDQGLTNG
jgi:hypothetical protein